MTEKLIAIVSRAAVCMPEQTIQIHAGRKKSIAVAEYFLEPDKKKKTKKVILLTQKDPDKESPTANDVCEYGTLCTVTNIKPFAEEGEKTYRMDLRGSTPVKVNKIFEDGEYYECEYEALKYDRPSTEKSEELIKRFLDLSAEMFKVIPKTEFIAFENKIKTCYDFQAFLNIFTEIVYENGDDDFRQRIHSLLPILSWEERVKEVEKILVDFISARNAPEEKNPTPASTPAQPKDELSDKEKAKIDDAVNKKVNETLSKQQREFYLKEKIKAIREEIGKITPTESDAAAYRFRIETNPYPQYIKDKVLSEISKLESSSQQESGSIKTYIEWLLDLPWWQKTEDDNSIAHARKVLDESHYGLEKVKERIIEYIAVRSRAPKGKAPIICLLGAPGVGKTSLAFSIAKALNKKFEKISLGGVNDQSEIRGHRRTYLGAMPGRIIKAMKQAKVINPLIVLDEIDKMSPDNRGDPAAALLEVLDPEQNSIFHDTFIEENYDLSNVLFICTANYGDRIPHALADRMEIIEVSSYTETEKLHIVKEYLIKKILNNNGIEEKHLKFPDEVIKFIIQHYTMEAGIREAERQINKIARKVVVELEANPEQEIVLTEELVKKYLGKIIYDFNSRAEQNISGVVNGMAYTTAGGDLLPIEVTSYPGKGSFVITGNLKETMRESVQVALGYVRSNAAKFGIGDVDFSNTDIHVHVPSGGIPKDGPSAGVTLTTALISCLNKKPVPANIAMTGEITLRGKVGIIGGVKEKMISAFRGGITEFFIPYDDERFLEDVPKEIRENVEVHLVKDYHEIYNSIFVDR